MFFKSFLYGILAAFGALIVELVILSFFFDSYFSGTDAGYSASVSFLLIAAALEEILKALFIFKLDAAKNINIRPYLTAPFVGLGFFAAEFALKRSLFSSGSLLQSSGVVLVHVATAFLFGYAIWKAPKKKAVLTAIIILNIALHFGYNLLVLNCS